MMTSRRRHRHSTSSSMVPELASYSRARTASDDMACYAPIASFQLPGSVRYHEGGMAGGLARLQENQLPVKLLVPPSYSHLVEELRRMGRLRNKQHKRNGEGQRTQGGSRPHVRSGGSRRSKGVQQELKENVRRTVYISDVDHAVTEEGLATFFGDCGCVVDCRVCGDPNSFKRFAFIEFRDEDGAEKALDKNGCVMGTCSIRVLPSKTAIVPVNRDFMPKNMQEMELCSRTVYVANIDKKVDKHDVKRFFESLCGKVTRLRLLGDYAHSTRIAFVEFTVAESALDALNCSGAVLGALPIRVSPSKAPVRMCSASDCED